ncbi:hypothetical protein Ocin01_17724, partial [Orchesella cincta]
HLGGAEEENEEIGVFLDKGPRDEQARLVPELHQRMTLVFHDKFLKIKSFLCRMNARKCTGPTWFHQLEIAEEEMRRLAEVALWRNNFTMSRVIPLLRPNIEARGRRDSDDDWDSPPPTPAPKERPKEEVDPLSLLPKAEARAKESKDSKPKMTKSAATGDTSSGEDYDICVHPPQPPPTREQELNTYEARKLISFSVEPEKIGRKSIAPKKEAVPAQKPILKRSFEDETPADVEEQNLKDKRFWDKYHPQYGTRNSQQSVDEKIWDDQGASHSIKSQHAELDLTGKNEEPGKETGGDQKAGKVKIDEDNNRKLNQKPEKVPGTSGSSKDEKYDAANDKKLEQNYKAEKIDELSSPIHPTKHHPYKVVNFDRKGISKSVGELPNSKDGKGGDKFGENEKAGPSGTNKKSEKREGPHKHKMGRLRIVVDPWYERHEPGVYSAEDVKEDLKLAQKQTQEHEGAEEASHEEPLPYFQWLEEDDQVPEVEDETRKVGCKCGGETDLEECECGINGEECECKMEKKTCECGGDILNEGCSCDCNCACEIVEKDLSVAEQIANDVNDLVCESGMVKKANSRACWSCPMMIQTESGTHALGKIRWKLYPPKHWSVLEKKWGSDKEKIEEKRGELPWGKNPNYAPWDDEDYEGPWEWQRELMEQERKHTTYHWIGSKKISITPKYLPIPGVTVIEKEPVYPGPHYHNCNEECVEGCPARGPKGWPYQDVRFMVDVEGVTRIVTQTRVRSRGRHIRMYTPSDPEIIWYVPPSRFYPPLEFPLAGDNLLPLKSYEERHLNFASYNEDWHVDWHSAYLFLITAICCSIFFVLVAWEVFKIPHIWEPWKWRCPLLKGECDQID